MRTDLGSSDDAIAGVEAGLDALDTPRVTKGPRWRRTLRTTTPPLIATAFLLGVWQIAFWAKLKPPDSLPSPHQVFTALRTAWNEGGAFSEGSLGGAIHTSLYHGITGFFASVAVGTPLGLLVARVHFIRTALKPLLSGLQSLPSVAWVPVGIIWFGISPGVLYFVILMGAVPSITLGMVSGIDQVPPLFTRVGKVLGARGLSNARHILLPAALPGYLAGLKQGWAFSWRSLMAAELITNSPKVGLGLGKLLDFGRENSDLPFALAVILAILVVGIAVELLCFAPLERHVLRRRGLLQT